MGTVKRGGAGVWADSCGGCLSGKFLWLNLKDQWLSLNGTSVLFWNWLPNTATTLLQGWSELRDGRQRSQLKQGKWACAMSSRDSRGTSASVEWVKSWQRLVVEELACIEWAQRQRVTLGGKLILPTTSQTTTLQGASSDHWGGCVGLIITLPSRRLNWNSY